VATGNIGEHVMPQNFASLTRRWCWRLYSL